MEGRDTPVHEHDVWSCLKVEGKRYTPVHAHNMWSCLLYLPLQTRPHIMLMYRCISTFHFRQDHILCACTGVYLLPSTFRQDHILCSCTGVYLFTMCIGILVPSLTLATSFRKLKIDQNYTDEPPHVKTNKMTVHTAKTQISLGICPVWSESSLCAEWVAKDPSFLHADSEDSDQTGRMPSLIWVFARQTCHFVGFVVSWLKWS